MLAKRGEFETGVDLVKQGLSLALEHGLTTEAADAYQRLGTCFETAGDYSSAQGALESALDLCRISGDTGPEAGCVACMAYVLRELGEWPRTLELCRELIGDHEGNGVAHDRRRLDRLRPRAPRRDRPGPPASDRGPPAGPPARRLLDAGRLRRLARRGRRLRQRPRRRDRALPLRPRPLGGERGPPLRVWGLRLAASLFAQAGFADEAHASAAALTRIATDSGHADALAALAHALGEIALLDGEPESAAEQLGRAVELHRSLRIPAERVQILHRAGVALAAAGERELAVERQAEAYRLARGSARGRSPGGRRRRSRSSASRAEQRLGQRRRRR